MNDPRHHPQDPDYLVRAAAESRKWGDHLEVEARGEMHAWLDHPRILQRYLERRRIDGLDWIEWIPRRLGRTARRSLDLGCGAAARSFKAWEAGASACLEGFDISEARVAEGERRRRERGIPGAFRVADANTLELEPGRYELIFSAHSFHHFLELEHVMEQVARALAPEGLFVLEEFVGPTQFQWTESQIAMTRSLLALLPPELRRFRWGAVKELEGRPSVAEVVTVSPFESIRSAEIGPLFARVFDVVLVRDLGGTIQHLLHNGIVHNFWPLTDEIARCLDGIVAVEDALVDSRMLPSDFQLLVGRRKS